MVLFFKWLTRLRRDPELKRRSSRIPRELDRSVVRRREADHRVAVNVRIVLASSPSKESRSELGVPRADPINNIWAQIYALLILEHSYWLKFWSNQSKNQRSIILCWKYLYFVEISPFQQNLKILWQFFESSFSIWTNYEPTLTIKICHKPLG